MRIRSLLFILLFSFLSLVYPLFQSHAQSNYYPNSSFLQSETNPDVPQNLHTTTQSLFIDILATINCYLTGIDPVTQDHRCLSIDPNTKKLGYVSDQKQGGILNFMTGTVASTFTYPAYTASTVDYFMYLAHNFRGNGISPAYAQSQGVGFQAISPFIPVWAAIRNVVYLILVVIFLIIGLGIMLRLKIDPRTVMTVQNQIPKLIAGLLLVTLSFAIAGLLIDMMYVVMLLFLNVLHSSGLGANLPSSDKLIQYADPWNLVGDLVGGGGGAVGILGISHSIAVAIAGIIYNAFRVFVDILIGIVGVFCTIIGILSVGIAIPICLGIVAGGAALLIEILFAVAIFTALFRFWVTLIECYIVILFQTVLAPVLIILGVLPGGQAGFGQWIRDMVANLAVFPVSLAFIYIIGIFIQILKNANASSSNVFLAPMVPAAGNSIGAVVGFVGILMLPDLVKQVKAALKSKDLFNVHPHLGAGALVFGAAGGAAFSRAFRRADPLRNIDEGFARRLFLGGERSVRRRFFERITGAVQQPLRRGP